MLDLVERCGVEVARLAEAVLPGARAEADLGALLSDVEAAVQRILGPGRPAGAPPPACGPGCASCCTIHVGTLAPEGASIAAWLRARSPAAELGALARRLAAFHDRVRWLEDRERILGRETCPFLDASRACTIHPVRPLACRSVSSLDAEDCRRAMSEVDGDGDEGPVVRMDLLQKALYDEAIVSLGAALERCGLDARCRDVSGMTAAFLGDDRLAAAFLAGASIPLE